MSFVSEEEMGAASDRHMYDLGELQKKKNYKEQDKLSDVSMENSSTEHVQGLNNGKDQCFS